MGMERRACVVCETNQFAEEFCRLDGQDYLRCTHCGLVYIDRLLPPDQLYKAYSGDRLKSLRRRITAPFRRFSRAKNFQTSMQRAEKIFQFADDQVQAAGTGRKYLDIGCNKGFLLAAADARGWNVYGIELVPEVIRPFVNSYPQYRTHILSQRFEDAAPILGEGSFDLITGIDVIEHFEDVLGDLKRTHDLLKPGGVLVIQTPDVGCDRAVRDGCGWGALKPLEHLHLFNCANVKRLAERVGFRSIQCHPAFEEADGNFVAVLHK